MNPTEITRFPPSLTPPKSKLCTLSPEILTRIMAFETQFPYATRKTINLWIHVCRHLRNVALSTPQLWSYLSKRTTSDLGMLQMMLSRSEGALLDVEIEMISPSSMDPELVRGLEGILHNATRLHRLELKGTQTVFSRRRHLLDNPAPFLQSLSIAFQRGRGNDDDDDDEEEVKEGDGGDNTPGFHFKYELFGGKLPCLRRLNLEHCSIQWGSSIFAGLTSLQVHHLPLGLRPTHEQMMSTLRVAQNLEVLTLSHCLPSTSKIPTYKSIPGDEAVKLSHLKVLDVHEHHYTVFAHFAAHIDLPRDTLWRIRVSYDYEDDGVDGMPVVPVDGPVLPPWLFTQSFTSPSPSRSLVLNRYEDQDEIAFSLVMYDRSLEGPEWFRYVQNDNAQLVSSFVWPYCEEGTDDLARHLHHQWPLSDVHTLKLVGDLEDSPDLKPGSTNPSFWEGLFRNASNVQRLLMDSDFGEDSLIKIFSALMPSLQPDSSSTILLPHLTDLHISGFSDITRVKPSTILEVIAARERLGSKVQKLTIGTSKNYYARNSLDRYAKAIGADVVIKA